MPVVRNLACAAILACFLTPPAIAQPFSDLIVFGDSLSDVGNIALATSGLIPGPYYHNGRFSSGPAYSELLSVKLGLGELKPSLAGGDNFAFGGAQTSGTGGLAGAFISDLDEQVDAFLARGTVDPAALYIVFAGSNDLLNLQLDVNVPVNNVVAQVERLIAGQARQFLVGNLPPLGLTPRFNIDPNLSAAANARSAQFNAALATSLDYLEATVPGAKFFRLDVAGLINDAVANPANYGLSNVTVGAAPGLLPGAATYDVNQIASDASTYLFWDDTHPTGFAHAILAERAFATVVPEPASALLVAAAIAVVLTRRGCLGRAKRPVDSPDSVRATQQHWALSLNISIALAGPR